MLLNIGFNSIFTENKGSFIHDIRIQGSRVLETVCQNIPIYKKEYLTFHGMIGIIETFRP